MLQPISPSVFYGKKTTRGHTHNLRARKNARLEENPQQCFNVSVRAPRAQVPSSKTASVKNFKIQQKDKNPVYKQAKLESSSTGTSSQDEYEFQVETPEGTKKKPKKRQPRLKNTMQTLWGLKIRPETKKKLKPSLKFTIQEPENVKPVIKIQTVVASKDLVPLVKKAVAPLQARTGNTLCLIDTAGVGGVHENCSDILVGNFDGKKNANRSTSENSIKCVQLNNRQTDEEGKENIPLVRNKPSNCTDSKKTETQLKERSLMAHSNSTPLQSVTSPVINNMSVNLSPIHADGHTNQSIQSTPWRNSMHASTPVQSKVCTKLSDNNKPLNETCPGNNQSKNQISIPIPEFPQSTLQLNQKETPLKEDRNTQHKSFISAPDFENVLSTSILESDAPNDGRRLSMTSNPGPPEQDRLHSRDQSSKIVPVSQEPGTWRLGSAVRYNFNINPNIDNCFGFDDDDTDLMDVIQPYQLTVPDRNVHKVENKPGNQFYQRSHDHSSLPQRTSKENEENMTSSKHLPTLFNDFKENDFYKSSFSEFFRRSASNHASVRPMKRSAHEEEEEEEVEEEDKEAKKEKQTHTKRNKTDYKRKEPPRRSYAWVRPRKRLAHDEEEKEEDKEAKKEIQTHTKRNKTVNKRKKMVQNTLLDQWAKELNSHFAEVDNTDLITE